MPSTLHRPDPVVCVTCQVSWLDPELACWICGQPGSVTAEFDVPWSAHASERFDQPA